MGIFKKSKDLLLSSPVRVPKKIKNTKRWRVNLNDLEEEYQNFMAGFEDDDWEFQST